MAVFKLPESTIVTVVALKKGKDPMIKDMTHGDFLKMKRSPNYNYSCYKQGFFNTLNR